MVMGKYINTWIKHINKYINKMGENLYILMRFNCVIWQKLHSPKKLCETLRKVLRVGGMQNICERVLEP